MKPDLEEATRIGGTRLRSVVQNLLNRGVEFPVKQEVVCWFPGVGPTMLKGLCALGLVYEDPLSGLSVKSQNALHGVGLKTKEQVRSAIESGALRPAGRGSPWNYGKVCHREVCAWVGLPDPYQYKRRLITYCPHCGKDVREA